MTTTLGKRWHCYKLGKDNGCGKKFYDLGKPEPICPQCGANAQEQQAKHLALKEMEERAVA